MGISSGREPAALARLRRRFSTWRASRTVGERIPAALWEAATQVAAEHGLSRAATALKLDYYTLKKRVDDLDATPPATAPAFVELSPSILPTDECVLEIENGDGARMRVQLKGQSLDLLALTRLMLGGE